LRPKYETFHAQPTFIMTSEDATLKPTAG
jgi:6-phosphofructokinase 1